MLSTKINRFARSIVSSLNKTTKYGRYQYATAKTTNTKDILCKEPPIKIEYTSPMIDGEYITTNEKMPVIDPRTEKKICDIDICNKELTDTAIKSSYNAFNSGKWSSLSGYSRGKILQNIANELILNRDYISKLETLDTGKTLDESYFDIDSSIEFLQYYSGNCINGISNSGKTISSNNLLNTYKLNYTLEEPIGIIGMIIPWNYPLNTMICKLSLILSTGNTCIIKPSETASLSCIYVMNLFIKSGLPKGVVNIIPGYGNIIGKYMVQHDLINKITFTGSTNTGKKLIQYVSDNNNNMIKPLSLELGGKSPTIICNDIDLNELHNIIQIHMDNCFGNAGQICTATSRIFVHEDIYDLFIDETIKLTRERIVGDPFDVSTEQGPLQNETQFKKVLNYISDTMKPNSKYGNPKLCYGGNRIGNIGYFIEPTIFSDVNDEMIIAKEEIFGPTMQIFKFKTIDEVIKRANNTNYGLAAGIFSNNIDTINYVTRSLKAGTVYVNTYGDWDASLPFGGYKQSGFGREKGQDSLKYYTQTKCIVQNLIDKPVWY